MKHGQIIFRFFCPTDQNSAETVHPTMRSFHNPSAGLIASFAFDRLGFLTSNWNMKRIMEPLQQRPYLIIVVPFVQANVLVLSICRLGPMDHNTFQRRPYQLHIVTVGPVNHQANRYARCFAKKASLNPLFPSIRGISTGFFSLLKAIYSFHHPWLANPNRSLLPHQILLNPVSRNLEKHQQFAILGTANEPLSYCIFRWRLMHSTGIPYVKRKKYHSSPSDQVLEAVHPRMDDDFHVSAIRVRSSPIKHPALSNTLALFSLFSSIITLFPIKKIPKRRVIRIGSK